VDTLPIFWIALFSTDKKMPTVKRYLFRHRPKMISAVLTIAVLALLAVPAIGYLPPIYFIQ
jgi:hypothetical protein